MADSIEACCFRDYECLELGFAECLEAGGLPMGVGSECGQSPTVKRCKLQACCFGDGTCQDQPASQCAEYGGTPLGRGIWCQAIEPSGCLSWGLTGKCCLPDGSSIPELFREYCLAIRGTPVQATEPCPEPSIDEECREPSADQVVGPIWSLELCARTTLRPRIADEFVEGYKPGYGVLMTDSGVRNRIDVEPCLVAVTSLFLDPRHYGSAVFCSRQARNPFGIRAHEGMFGLQAEEGSGPTKPGYGVYLVPYEAPDWSEVIVGSMKMRCSGVVT